MAQGRSIGGAGNSKSTQASKKNVERIVDEFLAASRDYSGPFSGLTESQVCAKLLWERFAGFLMYDVRVQGQREPK